MPETRFAPDALWASRSRVRRIAAVIAAVVVLPFVADTSTAPCGSSLASRSIAPGWAFHSTLPGSVVPPPAPKSRDVAPIPRARSRSSSSSTPRGYPRSSLARVNLRPLPQRVRRVLPPPPTFRRIAELRPASEARRERERREHEGTAAGRQG